MKNFFEGKKSQVYWIGVVIAIGLVLTMLSAILRSEADKTEVREVAKLVNVIKVERVDERVRIQAHGVVQADREISLKSAVNGRVVERTSEMVEGGLVEAGGILVRIDPRDYQNAVEQAKASLEKADFELQIERGRQVIAKREWDKLSPTIKTSDISEELALRKPHLKEKEAQLEAAKSSLEKAQIDLNRTEIRTPFDAVVLSTKIEVGDYLSPQVEFAKLAGTEMFRVQVSIPVSKLKWLTFPGDEAKKGLKIHVIQDLGGVSIVREGHVLRLLGNLDPNGRMARVLVGVDDPLGIHQELPFPLLIGSYVRVDFEGPVLEDIVLLPRRALREENKVWVKNSNNQLEVRAVDVIQKDEEFVYIREGLEENDQVVVSPIAIPIPGMLLQTSNEVDKSE